MKEMASKMSLQKAGKCDKIASVNSEIVVLEE